MTSVLSYTEDSFDAVICLNGAIPQRDHFEQLAHIPLIAADGAANALYEKGIGPEFIVGDLDSVFRETLDAFQDTCNVIVDPDQNNTDFEKALDFAASQLWNRILIVGMHGGEMEHSLNNWSILMRYGRSMQLTAYELDRYAIPIYETFRYDPKENELLSLIPQPLARITTTGLEWDLTDESIALGTREGARNRSAGGPVNVELHEGSLLFFCDARLPIAPKLS